MAIGIGSESNGMTSSTTDVDFYRYKYRDSETQLDGSTVDVSFVSPIFSVFEKYRFYLLENSTKVALKSNYRYRPDYVSYEYYGTTAWWQLVMWINDVKSIEYFTADFIIVPTADAVAILQNEAYSAGTYLDINEDEKHKKTQFCLYETPLDNIKELTEEFTSGTLQELTEDEEEEDDEVVFMRETFTMDIPTLRLKYVDLKYTPIEDSVKVLANCRPNLIYDKHYTLIENDDEEKIRVTWDPAKVNNAGLLFKLKEDDVVEVQYVTKKANVDESTTEDTTEKSTSSSSSSTIDTSSYIAKQTSLTEIDTTNYTDNDVVNKVNELVSIVKNGTSTSRNMSAYLKKQKTAKTINKLDFTDSDKVEKVNQLVRFFKNGVLKSIVVGLCLFPLISFGRTGFTVESQTKQNVKNYTPVVTSVSYDTVDVRSTSTASNDVTVTDKRIQIGDNSNATGKNVVDSSNEVYNAVAIGLDTYATNNQSVAIGTGARSESVNGVQIGTGTNTLDNSLKFRDRTIVSDDGFFPDTTHIEIGAGARSYGKSSVAIGGHPDFTAVVGEWFKSNQTAGCYNIAIGADINVGYGGPLQSSPPRYGIGIGTTVFSQYMHDYGFGSQLHVLAPDSMALGYGHSITSEWSTVVGMSQRPTSTMFFTNEVAMTNYFMNPANKSSWFVDMGINIGTANTIDYMYGVSKILDAPDPVTGMYVELEYNVENYKLGGHSWKYGKSHGPGTFTIMAMKPADTKSRGLKSVYINDDSLDTLIDSKIGGDVSGMQQSISELLSEVSIISNINQKISALNDRIDVVSNNVDAVSNRTASAYTPKTTSGKYDSKPDYRVEIGREAVADGWSSSYHQSIAIGADAKAHASATTAVGPDAEANGAISIALGWRSITLGSRAVSIGSGTVSGQDYWLDETTTRTNKNPKAGYAEASGDYSVGLGYNFKAAGKNSTAIGNTAVVTGMNSVQLGTGTNSLSNTLKFNDVTIVKEGKLVGAVDEGFSTNAVTKAELDPSSVTNVVVNDDYIAEVTVNAHTINTLNFDEEDVEELHLFPSGTRNYEVFIPDNAQMRNLLPITLKADLVNVTNSVILMNQTNVITKLPVMIKCREPMEGTIVLTYELFDPLNN